MQLGCSLVAIRGIRFVRPGPLIHSTVELSIATHLTLPHFDGPSAIMGKIKAVSSSSPLHKSFSMDKFITQAAGVLNREIDYVERRLSGGWIDLGGPFDYDINGSDDPTHPLADSIDAVLPLMATE